MTEYRFLIYFKIFNDAGLFFEGNVDITSLKSKVSDADLKYVRTGILSMIPEDKRLGITTNNIVICNITRV